MLMPALARAREEARKAACQGNEHNLGLSFAMYRNDALTYPNNVGSDYRESSDENLAALYPEYLEAIDTFSCPGGVTQSPEYVTGAGVNPTVTSADYTFEDGIASNVGPGAVVLADRGDDGPNHKGAANCLFVDAHVRVTKGDDSLVGYPNPEYGDDDPRIYHLDGGTDADGDGYYTAAAGKDDASLEGDADADDGDVAVH